MFAELISNAYTSDFRSNPYFAVRNHGIILRIARSKISLHIRAV